MEQAKRLELSTSTLARWYAVRGKILFRPSQTQSLTGSFVRQNQGSMAFIKVILIGNLTRDPELRVTPKGSSIAQFGVAANKKWTDAAGAEHEDVCFVDVEAWGKSADNITKFFSKGKSIYIEGSLKLDTWDDKTTGAKRSKHKIVLEKFEFIGGREASAPPEQAAAPRPAPAPRQGALPGVPAPQENEDVPF